jgi:hypothetical protein
LSDFRDFLTKQYCEIKEKEETKKRICESYKEKTASVFYSGKPLVRIITNGSWGGTRTPDQVVNSHPLCRLSYPGLFFYIKKKHLLSN